MHGWRQFRTLLERKAEKYGRDFKVISRWELIASLKIPGNFR